MLDLTVGIPRAASRYLDKIIGSVRGAEQTWASIDDKTLRVPKGRVELSRPFKIQSYVADAWTFFAVTFGILLLIAMFGVRYALGAPLAFRAYPWLLAPFVFALGTSLLLSLLLQLKLELLEWRVGKTRRLPARRYWLYCDPADFWIATVFGALMVLLMMFLSADL